MTEPTKDALRAERIADAWQPSDEYEHLGKLAAAGQQLAPSQLIALGLYREQQATARTHGRTDA
ncbi:MAG: hypothetical protein M3P89_02080 [Actinomycetota bacterium]|nr:hypothetical protein [Actinomycetota bacterium]